MGLGALTYLGNRTKLPFPIKCLNLSIYILCWSTDVYGTGTNSIMKGGAGVFILSTIPTRSFSFSMLPKTRRITARHPTPHPYLLVNLEYRLIRLLNIYVRLIDVRRKWREDN